MAMIAITTISPIDCPTRPTTTVRVRFDASPPQKSAAPSIIAPTKLAMIAFNNGYLQQFTNYMVLNRAQG